ncbi:MAG: AmmeMemoRadiSam system protein B [Spirochaetaceae bacterium]
MIRPRTLPPGWYPHNAEAVRRQLEQWWDVTPEERRFQSVIAPHAGWDFSGELAFRVLQRLAPDAEVVAVVGGHLRTGDGVRAAPEEAYETPLGPMEADLELLDALRERLDATADTVPDNTVEVQLPMVKYLFPKAKSVYLRAPADEDAVRLGAELAAYRTERGLRLAVVGSTDLTHYGPNFGFTPRGVGEESVRWVREENDRAFLDAAVSMDTEGMLRLALQHRSACSPGAAAAAAAFARELGADEGVLVGYASSYDKHRDASFVGYGGIGFAA